MIRWLSQACMFGSTGSREGCGTSVGLSAALALVDRFSLSWAGRIGPDGSLSGFAALGLGPGPASPPRAGAVVGCSSSSEAGRAVACAASFDSRASLFLGEPLDLVHLLADQGLARLGAGPRQEGRPAAQARRQDAGPGAHPPRRQIERHRRRLPLNRLKRLAQVARRSSGQALQRMPEERRYPTLVAFLHQTLSDATDEAIDLFDRWPALRDDVCRQLQAPRLGGPRLKQRADELTGFLVRVDPLLGRDAAIRRWNAATSSSRPLRPRNSAG